jgi:CHAT domain-containing protein
VGRPVTVAPSATHWCRTSDGHAAGRPLFVAGPGLPHAVAEVAAAAAGDADVLTGDEATVDAVVDAFGARRLLHVAAHGEFRADAPLFGGVDLADGRLTLLDLRTATGHPELVVLPACYLAATRPLTGGESLGAVAALLGLGVGTVIAPLHAVADEAAAAVMGSFHHHLARSAPSAALGVAVGEVVTSGEPAAATAASFTCAGRG